MSRKLPVFATVKASYANSWHYGPRILPYLVAIVVVLVAVVVGMALLGFSATVTGLVSSRTPSLLVAGIVVLFVVVWFAVVLPLQNSIQRLVYFGASGRVGLRFGPEEWMTVGALFKLMGAVALLLVVLLLPCGIIAGISYSVSGQVPPGLMLPMLVVVVLVYLWFSVRLYPILPAAAVGDRLTLRQSFALSKGNAWRIFLVFLLAVLPLVAIRELLVWLLGKGVVGSLVWLCVSLIILVVQSCSLALIYKHLKTAPTDALSAPSENGALPDPAI